MWISLQDGEGDPVRPDLCDDLVPPGAVTDAAAPDDGAADDGGAPSRWRNLIRLGGEPVDCPFPGEFTFNYTKSEAALVQGDNVG